MRGSCVHGPLVRRAARGPVVPPPATTDYCDTPRTVGRARGPECGAIVTPPIADDSGGDDLRGRRLYVFGPMRVESAGRVAAVPRGDAQRLLGFLALNRAPARRREVLAEILWPGPAERPRRSMSDIVYRVRRQLGDGLLAADADTIALDPEVRVDVDDFDRLASSEVTDDIEAASVLHAGELLPGVYDDWVLEHRADRQRALVAALARLTATREREGALDQAVAGARRLAAVDPLDEAHHQTYLRLLGRLGRYGEAIAHYESLKALLAAELGVAPLAATTEIVDRLIEERAMSVVAPRAAPVRFVGRTAERSVAVGAIEDAFRGRGSVLAVEGVAGIGKSRLLDEIVSSARWRRATVSMSDAREVPLAVTRDPLARVLDPILSAAVRHEIESNVEPALLGTLGLIHPDWRAPLVGGGRDDAARLGPALRLLGEVVASSGTVALVLDDLHWASASTWDHLASFADGFTPGGGLLVVAYRRPGIEATPGWTVLQDWERRGMVTFVTLGPLAPGDVAELFGATGQAVPDDVLAVTGGVPFYLSQWMARSDSRQSGDGASITEARLRSLSPVDRRALDAAAVLGETVPFATWLPLTGLSPLELGAVSDRLMADRWLVPTVAGHAFVHDILRATVYERLSDEGRRSLHEQAAEVVAQAAPDNWLARAHHLDRAGRAVDAAAAYTEAGRLHRVELAFSDALDAWGRALELLPRRRRRDRLELGLQFAEVCDIVGGREIRREILLEAIDTARRLGDDAALLRALLLAGAMASVTGEPERGERWLAEAEQLAQEHDRRSLADASFRRGSLLTQSGRWPEARREFLAALELVDPAQDRWLDGRVRRGLAITAVRMGRPAETARWLEEALAAYQAADDPVNELTIAASLLVAYYELGSWDRFAAAGEQALALARRLGDRVQAGVACQGLGLAALAIGDHSAARDWFVEAEAYWEPSGQRRIMLGAINTRGLAAECAGDPDEAIRLYQATIDGARAIDAGTEEAYASHDLGALLVESGRHDDAIGLLRTSVRHWLDAGNAMLRSKSEAALGLALLATGRRDEADALARSGLELFRSGEQAGEHPQGWLWFLARLLARLGRPEESDEVLDAARREIVRQASTIADPEQRRRFFERVPLNRAIVAATEGRQGSPRMIVARLATATAPLGRTLRPDELVDVTWTLHAADDDAIADDVERRRHRLLRLLAEAARDGAAPTDDDLAAALGVSRRTIIRDMAALGDAVATATRRRARHTAPAPD